MLEVSAVLIRNKIVFSFPVLCEAVLLLGPPQTRDLVVDNYLVVGY